MTWVSQYYPWIKSFHILGVIAWMAGMFYLPRLFAYHADSAAGSSQSETFKIMERRLLRAIINPAMVISWTFGLLLVFTTEAGVDWASGWPWVKAAMVVAMSALHGMLARWRREFAEDRNVRPARFYRAVNEVPTVLVIVIVIMVVVRPF